MKFTIDESEKLAIAEALYYRLMSLYTLKFEQCSEIKEVLIKIELTENALIKFGYEPLIKEAENGAQSLLNDLKLSSMIS